MTVSRRELLAGAAALSLSAAPGLAEDKSQPVDGKLAPRSNPIGISTYSFWQFEHEEYRDNEKCIDLASEWGFDGVEIPHRQMTNEDDGYLQTLKKRAFVNGLALMGFSTHQGFVSPKEEERKKNIDHTIHCIELAYALGIPTMRVN